jgi:hypothetical protein
VRGYALGYDLHFGTILKADPDRLWQLRLSTQPPARESRSSGGPPE